MHSKLHQLRNFVLTNTLFTISLAFVFLLPFFAGKIISDSQAYIFGQYINYLQIRITLHFLLALLTIFVAYKEKLSIIKDLRPLSIIFLIIIIVASIHGARIGQTTGQELLYAITGLSNAFIWGVTFIGFIIALHTLLSDTQRHLAIAAAIAIIATFQTMLGALQSFFASPIFPSILSKLGQPLEFTSFSYIGTTIFSRAYGTTPHPNFLGAIFVLLFILLLGLQIDKYKKLAISIVLFIGTILTLSKISVFAIFITLLLYISRNVLAKVNIKIAFIAIFSLATLVATIFITPNFSSSDESFLASRGIITTIYLKLLELRPELLLMGTGFKFSIPTFLANASQLETTIIYINRILAEPPHNVLLLLVVEFGIPLTILLLAALYFFVQKNFNFLPQWQKMALLSIITIFGAFDHLLIY